MKIERTHIKGLLVITPTIFKDDRGYFFESFNHKVFENHTSSSINFVQDNQSKSDKNVLRGLHFQNPPFDQGKLVRVIAGSVLDIAVDIRKNSLTYGKHFKIILDTQKHQMLWIPSGFAHGFISLEDNTIFSYKCTNYYQKDSEGCLLYNDQNIGIDWEIKNPILSKKDKLEKISTILFLNFKQRERIRIFIYNLFIIFCKHRTLQCFAQYNYAKICNKSWDKKQ
jgi:dTDP-4-dehydrorhamnose 3,5-epimerase